MPMPSFNLLPDEGLRVLDAGPDGIVFEALRPIVGGHAGYVQLGWSNRLIVDEFKSLRRTVLGSLVFCSIFGLGLAFILSLAITHPISHLEDAARQISNHDLRVRADVFSGDEVGRLATSFNDMVEVLELKEQTIAEKERARAALVDRLITSQEDERKALSRDLHDQIGQSLLALLVDLRSRATTDAERELTRDVKARIEHLLDEVRRVSKGMRPVALDHSGLASALRHYAEEASSRYDVDISYETNASDELLRLPDSVGIALYRVAQEATTNAVKHARPDHISLIFLRTADSAVLLVEDDGVGFDPHSVPPSKGLGLLGMQERISWLGGDLSVVSEVGEGTTVRARVSLEDGRTVQA